MSENTENTIKTREQLKQTFVTGAIPTQQDFHDWLDAYVHKNDEQAGSGQSGQQQGGDAITPLEQYINGKDGNITSLNVKRLPVPLTGAYYDSQNNIVHCGVIFHRGKFYYIGKAGKALGPLYAQQSVQFNNDYIDFYDEQSMMTLGAIDFVSGTSDKDAMFGNDVDAVRTIELPMGGIEVTVSVDVTNSICQIVVRGSERGYKNISVRYNGTNIPLYVDDGYINMVQPTDDVWGADDEADPYIVYSGNGSPNLYFKLVDQVNPASGELQYLTAECYYCEESDLEPGTYFYHPNESLEQYFEEVVVEETAE